MNLTVMEEIALIMYNGHHDKASIRKGKHENGKTMRENFYHLQRPNYKHKPIKNKYTRMLWCTVGYDCSYAT